MKWRKALSVAAQMWTNKLLLLLSVPENRNINLLEREFVPVILSVNGTELKSLHGSESGLRVQAFAFLFLLQFR